MKIPYKDSVTYDSAARDRESFAVVRQREIEYLLICEMGQLSRRAVVKWAEATNFPPPLPMQDSTSYGPSRAPGVSIKN